MIPATITGSKKWLLGAALALTLLSIVYNFHRLPSHDLLGIHLSNGMRTMEHAHAHAYVHAPNETSQTNLTSKDGDPALGEELSSTVPAHTNTYTHVDTIDFARSQNITRPDLFSNNYFYRTWMGAEFSSAVTNDLPPFEIMTRYIEQHSQQTLKKEWEDCEIRKKCDTINNRKFVLGMYSCPLEAGNRLHAFMNGLLWSVLTNRTLLARYETVETCLEYGDQQTEDLCTSRNEFTTPSHCDRILHLNPWVPTFDEWNATLALPEIHRAWIPFSFQQPADNLTRPYDNPENPKVIRTGDQVSPDRQKILQNGQWRSKKRYLSLSSSFDRLEQFRHNGAYFAYGMMLEALFTMDPSLLPDQVESSSSSSRPDNETMTYFVHSRHPKKNADPKSIYPEEQCVAKFNNETSTADKPCVYYIMSDRKKTLTLLESMIQNKTQCTVKKVESRSQGESFLEEHGPFAGRGYWEDVALASQARNGVIAYHQGFRRHLLRTSSAIVRELIEFRRVLEKGGSKELPTFLECRNPMHNV